MIVAATAGGSCQPVMLHIATVHYQSPRWIEIQTRELRRHLRVPFTTWASIQQIDPAYGKHFDRVIEQQGSHSEKLNHLALEITHQADEDDLLMFLDGDAFPIADPMPAVEAGLREAALVAVRRAENANEPQPHPCFCVTTVGTWQRVHGDWSRGYVWGRFEGKLVSDVGANLLRALELTNTPWAEILRTNGGALNPLFFGIYGDVVYHHGAGFRTHGILTRTDNEAAPSAPVLPRIPVVAELSRWFERRRRRLWRARVQARNREQSDVIFAKIAADEPDWIDYVRRVQGEPRASAAGVAPWASQ